MVGKLVRIIDSIDSEIISKSEEKNSVYEINYEENYSENENSIDSFLIEKNIVVPAIVRGKIYIDDLKEFKSQDTKFFSSNIEKLLPEIILSNPADDMRDINNLSVDKIIDFLCEIGSKLQLDKNKCMQEALEYSLNFSNLTRPILTAMYQQIPFFFTRAACEQILRYELPAKFLDGWVREQDTLLNRVTEKRAFGTRSLHILAGNVPLVTVLSFLRGALTKGDTIFKVPSNDPLTAMAILQTMIDVDAEHPLTKHMSAIYYKGGDVNLERKLISPNFLDRIIVWGGHAAVNHVKKYIQPGLTMISFDPKSSISIIGKEVFRNKNSLKNVAKRVARDIAAWNQEACLNSRVVFVDCNFEQAKILGEQVYLEMNKLPSSESTIPKYYPYRLELESLRLFDDLYCVFGGDDGEGAIIVTPETDIDFFPMCKTALIIPNSINKSINYANSSTQTVSIYPNKLKKEIRDQLILNGAQRIASLGESIDGSLGVPHDGLEPIRAMVRWGVDEHPLKQQ